MLCIKKLGSFFIGGRDVTINGMTTSEQSLVAGGPKREVNPNGTFSTGQMYVQYMLNGARQCKYPILFWHGGGMTGACWESTPDGRNGWQSYFLSKGYDTYLSDAVERGRASWSRFPEIYTSEPLFRSKEETWKLFRIGTIHADATKESFVPQQFPLEAFDAFTKQIVPRWTSNQESSQCAYDQLVKKIGSCIIIAHSQGSQFAFQASLRYPDLVKALVLLEPSSAPSGQAALPEAVRQVPHLYIWGDHLDASPLWGQYRKTIYEYYTRQVAFGANAQWIDLTKRGIYGNSHCLMGDKNSDQIAAIVHEWIQEILD